MINIHELDVPLPRTDITVECSFEYKAGEVMWIETFIKGQRLDLSGIYVDTSDTLEVKLMSADTYVRQECERYMQELSDMWDSEVEEHEIDEYYRQHRLTAGQLGLTVVK